MKRWIAVLVLVCMLIPMAGCEISVNEEALKEALGQAAKEVGDEIAKQASEALDDAVEDLTQMAQEELDKAAQGVQDGLDKTTQDIRDVLQDAADKVNGNSKDPSNIWDDEFAGLPGKGGLEMPHTDHTASIPEPKKYGLFGNKTCYHTEPAQYEEESNRILCACGEWHFDASVSYADFVPLVSPSFGWYKAGHLFEDITEQEYYGRKYVQFLGVDPAFFALLQALPEDVTDAGVLALEKIDAFGEALGELESFIELDKELATFLEDEAAEELMDQTLGFTGCLGYATQIASAAISFHKILDKGNSPEQACLDFVETVQKCTAGMEGFYGMYFSMCMDALYPALETFFEGYKDYKYNRDVQDVGGRPNNRAISNWKWLPLKTQWESALEGVEGLEAVKGGSEGTLLPSVEQAIRAYRDPQMDDEARTLVEQYIFYRLDRLYRENFGIGLQDFVKYLSE